MNLKTAKEMINILEEAGVDLGECFEPNYDIIYLPWSEEKGKVADKLEAIGCHWDSEYERWGHF